MRLHIVLDRWKFLAPCVAMVALLGCGSTPKFPSPVGESMPGRQAASAAIVRPSSNTPNLPPAGSGRGGYYQDDGPGEKPTEGLQATPDPEPTVEPYSRKGNRPYVVFGKTYTPITDNRPLVQRGVGSWYGKKFHGQRTSSGELYDMYKMSAAHPTLPIPSYARVTNLSNGAQVIVRVNDRGPFHSNRIIDLSYTAALKLGYLGKGSSELEVERLLPDEIARIAANKSSGAQRPPEAAAIAYSRPLASITEEIPRPEVSQPTPDDSAERNTILAAFSQPANSEPLAPIANATPLSTATSEPNFYLQLGAYGEAVNAESARARLLQNWAAALPPIEVVQSGILYRIYTGPFASRDKAANAAQHLEDGGSPKPLIIQR